MIYWNWTCSQACIAFCSAADVKGLESFGRDLAREALAAFCGCVRLTLYACRHVVGMVGD